MAHQGIAVIISPYHVGIRDQGVGAGPSRILDANIVERLMSQGVMVHTVEIDPVDHYEGEIGRSFELMRRIANAVRTAHLHNSFPIVLAGNCFSSVGVSAGVCHIPRDQLGLIWLDAHDDYHTPETLTSGYFDAMGVSMLTGESWNTLTASISGFMPLRKDNIIFCGVRDVTDTERQRLVEAGFKVVWGQSEEGTPKPDYVQELGQMIFDLQERRPTMIHWDLDCLDMNACGNANKFSAPGGLLKSDLANIGMILPVHIKPVSLTIASFDPSCSADRGEAIADIAVCSVMAFVESMLRLGMLVKAHE